MIDQEKIDTLIKELESKVQSITIPDLSINMRIKALEFAQNNYRDKDGSMGDGDVTKILAYTNKIYQYIMNGVIEDDEANEIKF